MFLSFLISFVITALKLFEHIVCITLIVIIVLFCSNKKLESIKCL